MPDVSKGNQLKINVPLTYELWNQQSCTQKKTFSVVLRYLYYLPTTMNSQFNGSSSSTLSRSGSQVALCASCDRCRARKTKCDGKRPCGNCATKYLKKNKLTRYVHVYVFAVFVFRSADFVLSGWVLSLCRIVLCFIPSNRRMTPHLGVLRLKPVTTPPTGLCCCHTWMISVKRPWNDLASLYWQERGKICAISRCQKIYQYHPVLALF